MRADASLPPRKIALIGATGFIGRRLAAHLTNRGDVVLALVRSRQSPHLAQLPPGILIREVRLDADNPALADALAEADAVIYAAGSVRGCGLNDFSPANVRGVAAVAGLLSARQPFVLLSSLAASQADLSPYAASKRLGERVLESADQVFPWTILRPTAVYGPGDRELLPVFSFMRRGFFATPAGPGQRLSFIHVDDLCRGILAALDHFPAVSNQTYSLDDGTPRGYDRSALAMSLRPGRRMRTVRVPRPALSAIAQLNLRLAKLFRYAPMLTPGKVNELTHPSWLGDNGPFTAKTGWRPEIDLAQGTRALFAKE